MRHRTFFSYLFGFIVWFGGVFALAYLLVEATNQGGGQSPGMTTLLIGGSMLATIILVPMFFLKQLTRLSRKVAHDDSKFLLKKITAHQERSKIQYY